MKPIVKTGLGVVGVVVTAALVVTGAGRVIERQSTLQEIDRLRTELLRARMSADRCRGSLQTSEASLRELGVAIDSLRTLVDSFEALDRRGVPADQYPEYLEIFDSYNDSVASWEGREQRLRTAETACRVTIEEHNALTDTLQTVLTEAGIEAG
ncbi:MAG: hypothetical protein AAF389_03280 [Gemmatimonadota bacterium]